MDQDEENLLYLELTHIRALIWDDADDVAQEAMAESPAEVAAFARQWILKQQGKPYEASYFR
ncbi:MAG TPA: hypothetical protein PLM79_18370 [Syntrophobacteraceae bacterium]|nr:hypothetical protein [Syntrophobacteraceae bacterium]